MLPFALFIIIILFASWFFTRDKKKHVDQSFTPNTALLEEKLLFYANLRETDKIRFQKGIADFLSDVRITGVDTTVEELDRLMIASAAIMPIFHFKEWKYHNLSEVLLYSDSINMNFESTGDNGRTILGLVGTGAYEGKMLLSRKSLREGFGNNTGKANTAVHEFVHLIDKSDGDTDGIPGALLDKKYVLPWLELIRENTQQIANNESDINPYAAMNNAEFLAVTAEYFFERPELLAENHPKLYSMLQQMFGAAS